MKVDVVEEERFVIVRLSGEVDLATSPRAREAILQSLGKKCNLLVDLSRVEYLDSSGVASLVEGYQTAKQDDLTFGLISVSVPAMNVLQLAHLDRVFPIYESLADCLQRRP